MPIKIWEPEDVQVIAFNLGAPGQQVIIQIQGWDWWLLASLAWSLDNTLSAVAALAVVQVNAQGNVAMRALAASTVAAGALEIMGAGMFQTLANVAATGKSFALAPCVVVGDGSVLVGFNGGAAQTQVTAGQLVVWGSRHRVRGK